MLDGWRNSRNTVGFSTCLPMSETRGCVIVAGWPTIFTTYMGGAGRLVTGENTTLACAVFVEDVTLLDMKGNDDD